MIRLHVVTEGQTEESFVRDVLRRDLAYKQIYVDAHSITTRRDLKRNRVFRGGLRNLDHLLRDIELWLKQEENNVESWVTTMVDLYAFPYSYNNDWKSGFEQQKTGIDRVKYLEAKLQSHFAKYQRFIPYVQLHEFETLLLTEPKLINEAFSSETPDSTYRKFLDDLGGLPPEDVNSGTETAPSKRIIKHYPQYEDNKATWGTLIGDTIGSEAMRNKCPHFNEWLSKLERLVL
jgi:hypothetical protein